MPRATRLLQRYFSYFKSFHDLNTIVSVVARCVPNLSITVVHSQNALLLDAQKSFPGKEKVLLFHMVTNYSNKYANELTP